MGTVTSVSVRSTSARRRPLQPALLLKNSAHYCARRILRALLSPPSVTGAPHGVAVFAVDLLAVQAAGSLIPNVREPRPGHRRPYSPIGRWPPWSRRRPVKDGDRRTRRAVLARAGRPRLEAVGTRARPHLFLLPRQGRFGVVPGMIARLCWRATANNDRRFRAQRSCVGAGRSKRIRMS